MAKLMVDSTDSSWTAYSSLLPSLSRDQQEALEEAACAHYCGRYQDADAIFDNRLPPSHTTPILAMQQADMLSSSGREHQRIELLENTLATLSSEDENEHPCLRILLGIMLSEAKFFALGQAPDKDNLILLRTLRLQLRERDLESLSDLEIRCITAYYEFVSTLEMHTNFIGQSDKTLFEDSRRNKRFDTKLDELKEILRVLRLQRRWRFAPTITQLVLKHSPPGLTMRDSVGDTISLCSILESEAHAGVRFRAVVLKRAVADILDDIIPSLAVRLRQEVIEILTQMSNPTYARWQDFCPLVASYMRKIEALSPETPEAETLNCLEALAEEAEARRDFLVANQLYIANHDVAKKWLYGLQDDDDSQPAVLQRYRQIQEAFMAFHRERTQSLYFYAAALTDFLSTLYIRYHLCSEMVRFIDEFLESYPDFAIPHLLERIYGLGVNATRTLDQKEKLEYFNMKHIEWTSKCNFWEPGGHCLTEKAVLDPSYALRQIHGGNHGMIPWGTNALGLMLLWAAHEWENGLITAEKIRDIFGPGLGNMPRGNVGEYLRSLPPEGLEIYIVGSPEDLRDTTLFLDQYRRLLNWALIPDRLPDRSSRLYAMSIFLQARIERVAEFLSSHTDVPDRQRNAVIEEHIQLDEIKALQAQSDEEAAMNYETQAISSAIHITLMRSCVANPVARGLITDAELQSRMVECRELIERYQNRGHILFEYHATTQLIRLIWQRHVHFQEPPDAVLPVAEEADSVFTKIRNVILTKDPSADLVTRAKLSKDFEYRDHCSYALTGSLTAMDQHMAEIRAQPEGTPVPADLEEKVWQSYEAFLSWAVHSKGPGFADILNLESGVAQSVQKTDDIYQPFQRLAVPGHPRRTDEIGENTTEVNPFGGKMATPAQIMDMLGRLPDNVVIVDFVNLKYTQGPGIKMVAVVYKKSKPAFISKIPGYGMEDIDAWVDKHIDEPQRHKKSPLNGPESKRSLEELSVLFRELTGPAELVPPGHILVICPTGSLNRVPLHAIPVGEGDDKKTLIERNPVVYCQSLTILHWLWQRFQDSSKSPFKPKATVVNPMPETWENGDKVMSKDQNQTLVHWLNAEKRFYRGLDLRARDVKTAVEGTSMLHYHGHVAYNPSSALDSILVLNKEAFTNLFRHMGDDASPREALSARDFFNVKLRAPALATIIGCASGVTTVSNTDDVLGFPTALFYAGAGAVVSTLWPIEDEDGAEFTKGLYAALSRQQNQEGVKRHEGKRPFNARSCTWVNELSCLRLFSSCICGTREVAPTASMSERDESNFLSQAVDIALAMQETVVGLLNSPSRRDLSSPYHWAAFTMNGFWLLPSYAIPHVNMRE